MLTSVKLLLLMYILCNTRTEAQHCGNILTRDNTPVDDYYQDGDLIIAFIAGFHKNTEHQLCTKRAHHSDFQKAHAIKYMTEKVNSDSDILPNTTLGLLFLDTCRNSIVAVSRAMQVLGMACNASQIEDIDETREKDPHIRRPSYKVVGVIGTGLSRISVSVSPVLSAYHIPQVCYASAQDDLSDKAVYPYFSRITTAIRFDALAISSLVQHFNWSYVALLYRKDSFGLNAHLEIIKAMQKKGICIAFEKAVGPGMYNYVVKELMEINNLRIIIFFSYSSPMRYLYKALDRVGATNKFIIILSGSFSLSTVKTYGALFPGTFSFGTIEGRDSGFEDYYTKSSPWNQGSNDWFGQFYPEDVDCNWNLTNSTFGDCANYTSVTDFPHFGYTKYYPFVMESVQVYAYAIHNMIMAECPDAFGNREAIRKCVDGPTLLKYIRNVKFQGITKYIEFDENGDIYAGLGLRYFRKTGENSYQLDFIGTWDRKQDKVYIYSDIEWYLTGYNSSVEGPVPESVCAHPCGVGEFYIQGELECCWECRRCRDNEYIREDLQGCQTCPMFTWPEQVTVMSCDPIEPTFMLANDWLAIGLQSLTSLGLLACLIIIILFVKYNGRKIIRGSSRELMLPIILGLVLAFTCAFAYVWKPTLMSCCFTYGGFHISCTLLFGPLFLKTLRVYRIFEAADKLQYKVRAVNGNSQIILVLFIILIEVGTFCK